MNAVAALDAIRAVRVALTGIEGERIAIVTIVVAGLEMPEVVMFNGDPFVLRTDCLGYRQVRPYRVDAGA